VSNSIGEFDIDSNSVRNSETMRSAREEFETKSNVKTFGATVGIVVTSVLVSMMVLGVYFFIRSFWLFAHPNFEFSVPKLPSLSLLSTGQIGDAPKNDPNATRSPLPNLLPSSTKFTQQSIQDYVDRLSTRGNSLADSLTPEEKFKLGDQVCQGLSRGFTQPDVAKGFEESLKAHFPKITGVKELVDDVMDSATRNLCPPK